MKFIFFVLFLVVFHTSFAQNLHNNELFNLKGNVLTKKNGFIWLRYADKDGKDVLDSVYLHEGKFLFTGSVNGVTRATLRFLHKSLGVNDPNSTSIFIENTNMTIEATENDFKNAKITGSKTQDDHQQLETSKKEWLQQKEALALELKELNRAIKNKDTLLGTSKKLESTNLAYQNTVEQLKQMDLSSVEAHPDSYLSPYLLNSYVISRKLSLDSIERFFNRFSKQVQNSGFGKLINDQIRNIKSSIAGASAPLFSLPASDGRQIQLQDFKGKNYVLLDFWASWCVPCRENIPKITNLYEKYKPMGLDIISISVDTDKKAWLKAVAQDQAPWHQLLDPIPFQDGGSMTKYAIPSIPLLMLIDKKGVIIGRYENGDLTNLHQKLKEIF